MIGNDSVMCSGEPQGKDGNQRIREKCKQYLDRAEELQEYLNNKEVLHANTHTRPGGADGQH